MQIFQMPLKNYNKTMYYSLFSYIFKSRFYLIGALVMVLLYIFEPDGVNRLFPCHCATRSAFTFKSTCNFSQIFFLGLSISSGLPSSKFSTMIRSPGFASSGGINVSTCLGSSLEQKQIKSNVKCTR